MATGVKVRSDGFEQAEARGGKWSPNPPYGERGSYRKLTVTLPQEIYQRLIEESARRKIEGLPNQLLSELLREALSHHFEWLESPGASTQ